MQKHVLVLWRNIAATKRLGFEYARTTEKRMIARSSQPEQSQNILQFRQRWFLFPETGG